MLRSSTALLASAMVVVACSPASPGPRTVASSAKEAKPAVVLPGGCVEPTNDALARLGPDATDSPGARTELGADLDGDSIPDPMVTHASFCGSGGCSWQLYVSRGGCGHYVGELFGLLPTAGPTISRGLVDLEITARNGCGGLARTETHARFDGRSYVHAAVRQCRCPEPAEEVTDDTDLEKFCGPWRPVAE